MKKICVTLFAVVFFLLTITGIVHAEVVLFEDFEDSSGFTIGGGYSHYWDIAPLGGAPSMPCPSFFVQGGSQSGMIFFGSFAKEYIGSPAPTMAITLPDLTGYTNLKLTVSLAAPDGTRPEYGTRFECTHRDSLHIIKGTPTIVDCSNAGCMPVTDAIDSFLPVCYSSALQSQVYPGTYLHYQFQDFTYDIDSSLTSITFAFASTDYDEVIGIDSVTITGDPAVIPITIDIKPGSDPNSINFKSQGNIPVAILSTEEFDALKMVNKDSLTFGPTGEEESLAFCNHRGEDVNGDGYEDLVCHFFTHDTGFMCGDTEGVLKGETLDGTPIPIEGRNSVRIVPCNK